MLLIYYLYTFYISEHLQLTNDDDNMTKLHWDNLQVHQLTQIKDLPISRYYNLMIWKENRETRVQDRTFVKSHNKRLFDIIVMRKE